MKVHSFPFWGISSLFLLIALLMGGFLFSGQASAQLVISDPDSDYPSCDSVVDDPNAVGTRCLTDEWLTPLGPDDKAKILWRNAARLYGLDGGS